jgi:hypothetical protein
MRGDCRSGAIGLDFRARRSYWRGVASVSAPRRSAPPSSGGRVGCCLLAAAGHPRGHLSGHRRGRPPGHLASRPQAGFAATQRRLRASRRADIPTPHQVRCTVTVALAQFFLSRPSRSGAIAIASALASQRFCPDRSLSRGGRPSGRPCGRPSGRTGSWPQAGPPAAQRRLRASRFADIPTSRSVRWTVTVGLGYFCLSRPSLPGAIAIASALASQRSFADRPRWRGGGPGVLGE